MNLPNVLDVPMQQNDADAATIREYLIKLLLGVWEWREGFDGKRPFGNSSWAYEIYEALARSGHVNATFDDDGYIDEFEDDARDKDDELILLAIRSLGTVD